MAWSSTASNTLGSVRMRAMQTHPCRLLDVASTSFGLSNEEVDEEVKEFVEVGVDELVDVVVVHEEGDKEEEEEEEIKNLKEKS